MFPQFVSRNSWLIFHVKSAEGAITKSASLKQKFLQKKLNFSYMRFIPRPKQLLLSFRPNFFFFDSPITMNYALPTSRGEREIKEPIGALCITIGAAAKTKQVPSRRS
jgi:hypothetical protein